MSQRWFLTSPPFPLAAEHGQQNSSYRCHTHPVIRLSIPRPGQHCVRLVCTIKARKLIRLFAERERGGRRGDNPLSGAAQTLGQCGRARDFWVSWVSGEGDAEECHRRRAACLKQKAKANMLSTPDDAVMHQMNLSSSCYLSEQEPPPPPFFLNYPDEAAYLDSAGYGCWLSPEQQHSFSPPAPLYSAQVQVQQQQAAGKTLCVEGRLLEGRTKQFLFAENRLDIEITKKLEINVSRLKICKNAEAHEN